MNDSLRNAIFQKVAFKGDEMRRYQAAVIYTALALHPGEFAADDVPEALKPQNATTAGCSFALLKSDGLSLFIRCGRRASKTPSRNSAWINTYKIASRELAKTWLEPNGFPPADVKEEQQEMSL